MWKQTATSIKLILQEKKHYVRLTFLTDQVTLRNACVNMINQEGNNYEYGAKLQQLNCLSSTTQATPWRSLNIAKERVVFV